MIKLTLRGRHSLVLAVFSLGLLAGPAMAGTPWERLHPRRDQVNDRAGNLERRIDRERREGELTGFGGPFKRATARLVYGMLVDGWWLDAELLHDQFLRRST